MIIKNGNVFTDGKFQKLSVRVENGRFKEIGSSLEASADEKVIDASGKKVIPGMFDVHTHGCLGLDFSKSSAEEDAKMCYFYASHGVTSILATTMTNEPGMYRNACREIRALRKFQGTDSKFSAKEIQEARDSWKGIPLASQARVRGINMEGPFISTQKKGAHDPQYIFPVSDEFFDDLNGASGDAMCLITIAPELDGAIDFIARHKDKHFSIGHSACDYDTAIKAAEAGADHVTHLFNTMNGLGHRSPGIVAAAVDKELFTEIICDGLHVQMPVIRMMFKCLPNTMVLISDSINPTGLPEGKYSAGGLDVYMKNGEIRLADGVLAGSSISLYEGMVRVIRAGVPEEQAIPAASYNPAKSVGLENETGSIACGLSADFLIVDSDYNLEKVFIEGVELLKNN